MMQKWGRGRSARGGEEGDGRRAQDEKESGKGKERKQKGGYCTLPAMT